MSNDEEILKRLDKLEANVRLLRDGLVDMGDLLHETVLDLRAVALHLRTIPMAAP